MFSISLWTGSDVFIHKKNLLHITGLLNNIFLGSSTNFFIYLWSLQPNDASSHSGLDDLIPNFGSTDRINVIMEFLLRASLLRWNA